MPDLDVRGFVQRKMWRSIILALFCCLLCGTALALDDPDIPWHVEESAHFIIHYPASRSLFAGRALSIAEEAYSRLSPALDWQPPEKIHVSVIDLLDTSNGWARVVTNSHIRLYTYPPAVSSELGDYDDWMRQLFYHELTHVLHLDTAGIPHHVVDVIVGKIAKYNTLMPTWFTEGLAVYYETLMSDSGRLRNAMYRTMVRNAAINGTIPSFPKLSMGPLEWPGAAGKYIFGSAFIGYIAEHYGRETLTEWNHRYGDRIVPFFMNVTARNIWGKSWVDLYEEWQAYEVGKAWGEYTAAQVSGTLTPHTSLVVPHRHTRPQVIPKDSEISFVYSDGYSMPAIVRYDPVSQQMHRIVECSGKCEHHWNSDGTKLYYIHSTSVDGYRSRDRLYVYDVVQKDRTELPYPDHVRSFALDRDDTLYWVVQNNEWNVVYRKHPDQPYEQIYKSRPFEQIDDLNVYNGTIVASVFDIDKRQYDIEKLELEGNVIRRQKLTDTKSPDMSPYYCDDSHICYVSSKGGALNLWQHDLSSGTDNPVTHLLDGILHPVQAPDGDIYYTQYTSQGTTISRIAHTALVASDRIIEDRSPTRVYPALLNVSLNGVESEKPYQWLFPRRWNPRWETSKDNGWSFGIEFWGRDEIDHHNYTFSTLYHTHNNSFDFEFQYDYNRLPWALSLNISQYQGMASFFNTKRYQKFDYQTETAQIGARRYFNSYLSTHSIGLNYLVQYSNTRDPLSWYRRDPAASPVRLPSLGFHNAFVFNWYWSSMRQTELAFVSNDGFILNSGLRLEAPWLGADDYTIIWTFGYSQAWTMPYLQDHVVTVQASTGLSWSENENRIPFSISTNRGFAWNSTGEDTRLHGYPSGSLFGKNDLYFHVDYTALLWNIEYSYSTFPLALYRLGASPFLNWAYVWSNDFDITQSKYDIGCQMRLDMVWAYEYRFSITLGYAWGGASEGGHEVFLYLGLK